MILNLSIILQLEFLIILFPLFVLSVDSASGAFASNDEGAVMDTGGV